MTTPTAAPQTASQIAYEIHQATIASQLAFIGKLLEKHAAKATEQAKTGRSNWGLPGDLEEVQGKLADVISFLR